MSARKPVAARQAPDGVKETWGRPGVSLRGPPGRRHTSSAPKGVRNTWGGPAFVSHERNEVPLELSDFAAWLSGTNGRLPQTHRPTSSQLKKKYTITRTIAGTPSTQPNKYLPMMISGIE